MFQKFFPKFKVVEINDAPALRNGHMLAQSPAYAANVSGGSYPAVASKTVGDYKFIENGIIVGLGASGIIENFNPEAHAIPFLHFTEELIAGPLDGLDQFAIPTEAGKPAYPRCLALYVGTTFTTNNYTGDFTSNGLTYADVVNGVLKLGSDVGPFAVKESTMPDGSVGAEFTYIGYPATIVAVDSTALNTHINNKNNPHAVTLAQVDSEEVVDGHISDKTNPHVVTTEQAAEASQA